MVETTTNNRRKWFRRKGSSKKEEATPVAAAACDESVKGKNEAPVRRGLFGRARKKKVITKNNNNNRPQKAAAAVGGQAVIIPPSNTFETGTDEASGSPRREFKFVGELKEIQLKTVGNSMDTHQDSVSSAQEESLNGDSLDLQHQHQYPVQTPPRKENDANETSVPTSESNALGPHDEMILEISSEVVSQAPTTKACGSPSRSGLAPENNQEEEQKQHCPLDQQGVPPTNSMPDEVVMDGVKACETQEDLTVFSEDSDDRALGISTPPALKRSRSKSDFDSASKGASTASPLSHNFDFVSKSVTSKDSRALQRMELETLKKQVEDEKMRIKQQLEQEDARLAAAQESEKASTTVPSTNPSDEDGTTVDENAFSVIDWDVQGELKPIAVTPLRKQADSFDFATKREGSFDPLGFADFQENFDKKSEVKAPSVAPSSVAPSSTTATESFFRFSKADAKKSEAGRSSIFTDVTSEAPRPDLARPDPPTVEPSASERAKTEGAPTPPVPVTPIASDSPERSIFRPSEESRAAQVAESSRSIPVVTRTTSDGSMGLETGSSLKRSHSKGSGLTSDLVKMRKWSSSPDPPVEEQIEISRSRSTEEPAVEAAEEPVVEHQEPTKLKASEELRQLKKKKKRHLRRQRAKEEVVKVSAPSSSETTETEKDYKVRLMENELSSRFGGVEVEHMPEDATETQSQASCTSHESGGSRSSWLGSRVSGNSGLDSDSHYDSDPDPFSGIEEARLAALTLALKNAREAVASKTGETDALINDTTFSKRPTRVLFQRKAFFKRLKQGREKKGASDKTSTDDKLSDNKVIRKGKLAPQENRHTVRVASTRIPAGKGAPPPPPPRTQKTAQVSLAAEIVSDETAFDSHNIPASFIQRATAASDIEVNVDRDSPNNILRNVSIFEEERESIVSDADEGEIESEATSWDEEGSQSESSDDDSIGAYGVQVLKSVARSFSRTITWTAGMALNEDRILSSRSTMSDGFLSDNPLSEAGTFETLEEDDLRVNRSFSFSAGGTNGDDVSSSSSDEDTIRSEDILALKGRFACM